MNALILKNDGTLLHPEKRPGADILSCLGSPIVFEEGFTLAGFFRLVRTHPDLLRLSDILPGLSEAFGNLKPEEMLPSGLDRLELTKSVDMIGFPGPVRLEIYSSVRGVKNGVQADIRHDPIETMLQTPLVLGSLRHVIFGDKIEEMVFDTTFTLFEMVDSLAWELGFHNAPLTCAVGRQ